MQQYLTLEEAAKYLQMPPDELRDMAKRKAIRAFQDRGSWRFRSQDIEELARARGLGSDPQMPLGEAKKPPSSTDSKKSGKPPPDSGLLPVDFELDDSDEVQLGREKPSSGPRSAAGRSGRTPKPGSDSDVRLVDDSDVRLESSGPKPGSSVSSKPGSGSGKKKRTGVDSSVRLVGGTDEASDSDVKLEPSSKDSGVGKQRSKDPSDSDIRLHEQPPSGKKKGPEAGIITEEIDLDAEEARLAEKQKKKKPTKPTQMSGQAGLPTQSPFELSEPDLDLDKPGKGGKPAGPKKADKDSSSDFELIPFDSSKSPVELGSGEIPLLEGDEEVTLGSEVSGPNAGNSGINLRDPVDSGVSLESGGSDEIEFELSLDEGTTP